MENYIADALTPLGFQLIPLDISPDKSGNCKYALFMCIRTLIAKYACHYPFPMLTFRHGCATLHSRSVPCLFVPSLPPRMNRVNMIGSQTYCRELSLSRTQKLRPSWKLRKN